MGRTLIIQTVALLFLVLRPIHTAALTNPGEELGSTVSITTKLGSQVDLGLTFTNHRGAVVKLGDVIAKDRPSIFVPAYYHCPRLCGLILAGMFRVINELTLELGSDYRVVTVTIDPQDTVERANQTRGPLIEKLIHPDRADPDGWSFLTGDEANIKALMQQLGFGYKPDGDEYAHSAAIMLLTPDGKISQYFTGINFAPGDLRLALVEASEGNIGSPLDHVLLFCFRFDPTKGKYTWAAWATLRVGGLVTLLLLGGLLVVLWRRERRTACSAATVQINKS